MVMQIVAVGLFMPVTTLLIYVLSTPQGAPPFWEVPGRMDGWTHPTFSGLLLAPWTALATIVRQKEAFARDQKLAFELERSELERQALDAQLHLLQAQVAPHFLFFNTLANACRRSSMRSSPHASAVLRSLPPLYAQRCRCSTNPRRPSSASWSWYDHISTSMQMRMPDRLHTR